ncbi:xyloglucan endo-transglycosylase [Fusarium heterosporum]|uniref:Xyloglucan endo-transglycosylase n=1 Tax=Fusarium heterosporum TaxID=42747 RepID=A0A8H5TYY2_FUSHE|nr:xyloglucan endo-transglycosylase [Fusarium heterosporum]
MSSTKSILASLLAIAPLALAQEPSCDCYVTKGDNPQYYKDHAFFDFRYLSEHAGVPALIDTVEGNANADFTSDYFNWGSEFTSTWGPQKWNNGNSEFPMQNSYNNLYIEENDDSSPASDTWLTMRTARHNGFHSASEFESLVQHQHVSLRMFARTKGSPGACTAMFTYKEGKLPETLAEVEDESSRLALVQEADIEVLTRDDPSIIHYTNQPSRTLDDNEIEGAHLAATLPDGLKWTDWAKHTIDWTPDATIWKIADQEIWKNSFLVPRDPSTLSFNAWSNGDDGWTGAIPEGGVAYQQIQWIELLSGRTDAGSCSSVCSVDDSELAGKPVPV